MKAKNIDQLIHNFYHSENRSQQCGNMRYEGDVLYSYAEPIARIVRNRKKHYPVVILSSERWSVTTSKHQELAWRYSPHGLHLCPCRPDADYLSEWIKKRAQSIPQLKPTIKGADMARDFINAIVSYGVLSGDGSNKLETKYYTEYQHAIKVCSDARELQDARNLKSEECRAAAAAKRAAEIAARMPELIAGFRNHTLSTVREAPPMLRLSQDGQTIETSWGASVPVAVAPGLWTLVQEAREYSDVTEFTAGAFKVGTYSLDRVNADGSIKVGCHNIAYSELEGIAKQLNFIK